MKQQRKKVLLQLIFSILKNVTVLITNLSEENSLSLTSLLTFTIFAVHCEKHQLSAALIPFCNVCKSLKRKKEFFFQFNLKKKRKVNKLL